MLFGIARLVMASIKNCVSTRTQGLGVGRHRGSVQEQSLPVNLDRPLGIGAKKKWILDQSHGSPLVKGRMVRKQLMGEDQGDLHRQRPSPARRQARRPRAVA